MGGTQLWEVSNCRRYAAIGVKGVGVDQDAGLKVKHGAAENPAGLLGQLEPSQC